MSHWKFNFMVKRTTSFLRTLSWPLGGTSPSDLKCSIDKPEKGNCLLTAQVQVPITVVIRN